MISYFLHIFFIFTLEMFIFKGESTSKLINKWGNDGTWAGLISNAELYTYK